MKGLSKTTSFAGVAAALGLLLTLLSGCSSKEQHWTVSGSIDGGAGKTVLLESVNNGNWHVIDSVKADDAGVFSLSEARMAYPDIYRLTVDGRSLYFPIDSTETVNIKASLDGFDTDYQLSGSASAELMQQINDKVNAAVGSGGEKALAENEALKREIAELMQADWGGIVAYYAINKSVGETPLFDPANNFDRRIIGAVANAFNTNDPSDPRAALLKDITIGHRHQFATPSAKNAVYADEIPFMEIKLLDKDGRMRSLTEEWQKGKVIVLNFTLYGAEMSPAYNVILNNVYDRYKSSGLEIYQVGCDEDEFVWRESAKNIPWIAVFNAPKRAARTLLNYNIQTLPTTFVIDRSGDRVERVEDVTQLESVVAKMF